MRAVGTAYAINVIMFGYQQFSGFSCLVFYTTSYSIEVTLAQFLKIYTKAV